MKKIKLSGIKQYFYLTDEELTGFSAPENIEVQIQQASKHEELEEIIRRRKAEYPNFEQFLDAYFDGGQVALDALQAQRLAIKAKYPKP